MTRKAMEWGELARGISEIKERSRSEKLLWEYMPLYRTICGNDYIAELWYLPISLEVADKADWNQGPEFC